MDVGDPVGSAVGVTDGMLVGASVGDTVGSDDGTLVGSAVDLGTNVGMVVS